MGYPHAKVKHLIEKLKEPAKKPLPRSRYRSAAEVEYAAKLEAQKRAGEILDWKYELVAFTLGRTETGRAWTYLPDFFVVKTKWFSELSYEFHEVKGKHRGRERGIAKFRAAKSLFPWFNWVLIGS